MKKHSEYGFDYIRRYYPIFSDQSLQAILDHHERYDGAGYPNGKNSSKISDFAKIITLVDVFDALTSDRPYREAVAPSDAIEYIMAETNKAFDPITSKFFLTCVMPYSPGTTVKLSNGWQAIVVRNNFSAGLRPKIRIISQTQPGDKADPNFRPFEIDLLKEQNYLDVTILGNIQ